MAHSDNTDRIKTYKWKVLFSYPCFISMLVRLSVKAGGAFVNEYR